VNDPVEQSGQVGCPGLAWKVPGVQARHPVCPLLGCALPALQGVQAVEPLTLV
jgi:hypothetical protein